MNKYFYIFINVIFLCLVLNNATIAQNLTGYILDSETSEPLIGASIICDNENSTISNHEGYFSLESCNIDSISISYIGYEDSYFLSKSWEKNSIIYLNQSTSLLDAVTVIGSKYREESSLSVVSIESISVDQIKRQGTPNIRHFLNQVVGVQIIDGQANIRGGSGWSYGAGSRVMLLIDGLPILQGDAANTNWRDIPTENISNLEVLKGASSILYGSSALNGVISIQTEFPNTIPQTEISTQVEIFDSPPVDSMKWWSKSPAIYTGSIVHRQKFNKLDVVGSLFYYDEVNYIKGKTAELKRGTVKLRYRLKPEWIIGINTNINDYQGNTPFYWENYGAGTLISDTGSYSKSNSIRYTIDPYIKYSDPNGGNHKLQMRYYNINNEVERNRNNKSQQYFAEYQYTKHLRALGATVTAGGLFSNLKSDSKLYSNEIFHQNNLGLFVQVEKKLSSKLKLIGGIRYELNSTKTPDSIHVPAIEHNIVVDKSLNSYDKTVGRIGINYEINQYSHLRASWGQGYRYPSIAERFISTNIGLNVIANPELESETGWSAEIGWNQGIKLGSWQMLLDLSFFHMEYDNMIEFNFGTIKIGNDASFGFQANNIGGTIIRGSEIQLKAQHSFGNNNRVSFIAGYNYIDPKHKNYTDEIRTWSTSAENVLKYRQKHQTKANVLMEIGNLSLGATYRYISKTEAIDSVFHVSIVVPGVMEFDQDYNNNRHIFDAMIGYNFSNDFRAQLNVRNIGNILYTVRPAFVEEIRSYTIKLSKKINYSTRDKDRLSDTFR